MSISPKKCIRSIYSEGIVESASNSYTKHPSLSLFLFCSFAFLFNSLSKDLMIFFNVYILKIS